jgi:hypothetical protein
MNGGNGNGTTSSSGGTVSLNSGEPHDGGVTAQTFDVPLGSRGSYGVQSVRSAPSGCEQGAHAAARSLELWTKADAV